jgi:hypothetical protein
VADFFFADDEMNVVHTKFCRGTIIHSTHTVGLLSACVSFPSLSQSKIRTVTCFVSDYWCQSTAPLRIGGLIVNLTHLLCTNFKSPVWKRLEFGAIYALVKFIVSACMNFNKFGHLLEFSSLLIFILCVSTLYFDICSNLIIY